MSARVLAAREGGQGLHLSRVPGGPAVLMSCGTSVLKDEHGTGCDLRGGGVSEGEYMSRRLLQLVLPVFPDRRMFRLHDPEINSDATGGPAPPSGALVSAHRAP